MATGTARAWGIEGPEDLAVARRIRARHCVTVGILPLHRGLQVAPLARRMGRACLALGDSVALLVSSDVHTVQGDDPGWREEPLPVDGRAGLACGAHQRCLADLQAQRFARIFVDLSKVSVSRHDEWVLNALDAILFIAKVGSGTEWKMRRLGSRVDLQRRLGLVLVG